MNIKELKELIQCLPDEMTFGLLDLSTDDELEMNYHISKDSFDVIDCYADEEEEFPSRKALFLCFNNNLREELQEFRANEDGSNPL